ncbi:MAG: type secretion protein DotN [Ramlibacter sp.]|jgi:hypothetical protein|nr:type secretion protein DotN [Ramlibacter sp.]
MRPGEHKPLLVGVITDAGTMRNNSGSAAVADAEFQAKRKAHLERTRYRCAFCSLGMRSNEVHHRDGDHANNDESNFATACYLCHGYHHLGQRALGMGMAGAGQGEPIGVALIPEISAVDLNLFIMAAGAALHDRDEVKTAWAVLREVFVGARRTESLGDAFAIEPAGAPASMAAALAELAKQAPDEYEGRAQAVAGVRIIPHVNTVKALGERFAAEFASLAVKDWKQVAHGLENRTASGI